MDKQTQQIPADVAAELAAFVAQQQAMARVGLVG